MTSESRRSNDAPTRRTIDPRDDQFGRNPRDPDEKRGLLPKLIRPNTPPSNDPGRPPKGPASVSNPSTDTGSDANKD
ncbi:hypothetical protein GCM10027059_35450 [Myceligenerans halotolerans]